MACRVTRRPGSPVVEWVKELRSSLIFPLIRGITYRLIVPVIFDEFSKTADQKFLSPAGGIYGPALMSQRLRHSAGALYRSPCTVD